MIKLADGRGLLYQWDTGRQVECDAEQVHFSNHHYGTSIDINVKDGKATIPNQLLTSAMPIKAWAWVKDSSGEYTKEEQIFLVAKRNKPSDYVYTPTEIKTWQDLQNQIGDLNNLTTVHKDNLVNAINDAAGSGGASTAEEVSYTHAYERWVNVKEALDGYYTYLNAFDVAIDELAQTAHTHDNKSVLDKLSVADGKLQYNGSDVGLKGDKGDKGDTGATGPQGDPGADGYTPVKGTDYWTAADKAEIVEELKPSQVTSGTSITLADNTEYRLTDVTTLTLTYPTGNFESWMRLAFAAEGTITVTLPATTQYIGTTPTFANGETWEMSIKDGIVIAGKVA